MSAAGAGRQTRRQTDEQTDRQTDKREAGDGVASRRKLNLGDVARRSKKQAVPLPPEIVRQDKTPVGLVKYSILLNILCGKESGGLLLASLRDVGR